MINILDTACSDIREHIIDDSRRVRDAVFSPDGGVLAVQFDGQSSPKFYDTASGVQVPIFSRMPANGIAFRPGYLEVAIASSKSKAIQRFSLSTGSGLMQLPLFGPEAVAYSRDGSQLASGSANGSVCVWDLLLETPMPQFAISLRGYCITDLAFDLSGKILFVNTAQGQTFYLFLQTAVPGPHRRIDVLPCLLGGDRKLFEWQCFCLDTNPRFPLVAFGGESDIVWILEHTHHVLTAFRCGLGRFVRKVTFLENGLQLAVLGELGACIYDLDAIAGFHCERVLEGSRPYLGREWLLEKSLFYVKDLSCSLAPSQPGKRALAISTGGETLRIAWGF